MCEPRPHLTLGLPLWASLAAFFRFSNTHTSHLSVSVTLTLIHPTYRFRFTTLGLALLLPFVIHTKTYSYLSALQLYGFGHISPAVLYARDSLRIDNKLRTSALRSTRTRDLDEISTNFDHS